MRAGCEAEERARFSPRVMRGWVHVAMVDGRVATSRGRGRAGGVVQWAVEEGGGGRWAVGSG